MTFLFVRGHILAAQGVASSAIQRAASPRARVAGASNLAGLRRHDQRQIHRGPPWRQRTSVAVSDSGRGAVRATPARQQYGWARPVGQTITTTINADMGQQGYPQGAIPEWPWAALSAPLSQTAL